MADFDPYLKWLGIRETHRPVNHYRLLGLELYESDPDVISTAADRQMAHVRTYQNGDKAEQSQQILSELAIARRCLLVLDQKLAYDNQLKATLQPSAPAPVMAQVAPAKSPPPFPNTSQPGSIAVKADSTLREKRQKKEKNQMLINVVGWVGGGVAAVVVGGILIATGILPGLSKKKSDVEERPASIVKVDPTPKTDKPRDRPRNNPRNQPQKGPSKITKKPPVVQPNPNRQPVTPNPNSGSSTKPVTPINRSTTADQHDPNYRWDRAKIAQYEQPDADTRSLISLSQNALRQKQTNLFEPSSKGGGNRDYQLEFNGGLLIGFAFSSYRDGSIKTMGPITLQSNRARIEREYGRQRNPRTFLVARPGYAVGEVEFSTKHPMKCVRLVYMKILADRLDPSDQYTSQWYPKTKVRPVTRVRNAAGMPIVGVHGRYLVGSNVASLGLIGARTAPSHHLDPPETNVGPVTPIVKSKAPTKQQVTAARKELLQLYKDQIAQTQSAKSIRLVQDFAKLLIDDAIDADDQPAIQYAMLGESVSVSVRIGDIQGSVDAIRELDRRFEVDKWEFIENAVEGASNNVTPAMASQFKRDLDKLIKETVEEKQFKQARMLIDKATTISRSASDRNAIEEYRNQERYIAELIRVDGANTRGLKKLTETPDDPSANEDVGIYLFVLEEDVNSALSYWAKANDKRLQNLVELESKMDSVDHVSIMETANAWEELGQANRSIKDKKFLQRALQLTEQAADHATGLEKRKIETKASELSDLISTK